VVEVIFGAICTASNTFHGINAGVISLVALKFCIIPRDYWVFALCPLFGIGGGKKETTLLHGLERANLSH
jgi:hypothetical protein